jgi:hypothetical protein
MSELTSDKKYDSILKIIDEHLLPDIEAKKQRGEVFTPPQLVRELLFGLKKSALDKGEYKIWGIDDKGNFVDDDESDRIGGIPNEIWRNPESTFLDPANGIGNFPVIAFYKLDYELKKQPKFKDANKRRKHIIEKMLYMIELDKGNCQTCRAIFKKICPEAKLNICCKNTLTITDKIMESQFGINRFDIIMGNPPFQDADKSGGKNKLYERFTIYSLNLLSPNGLLLFVTPDNLFSGNTSSAYTHILSKFTLLINFNNIQETYFKGIGQSMCYFIISNTSKYQKHNTIIINNNNEIFETTLKNRSVNPITKWTKSSEALFNKYISSEQNNAIYYRGKSESDYKGGKYTVIYTPDKMLSTNNIDLAPGIGIKKVVLFESKPKSKGVIDFDGKYGVGPHTFYLPFTNKSEGVKLKNFFNSPDYLKLVELSLTSQYLKTGLIKYLNINSITKQFAGFQKNTTRKLNTKRHRINITHKQYK